MCLIVFSISKENKLLDSNSRFSITLMANRDEYYERPTSLMDWWNDRPILAGKDESAGGTWFAIGKDGRFAAITNYKENGVVDYELSRGKLVTDFIEDKHRSAKEYFASLKGDSFAAFNLLVSDSEGVHSFSNRREGIVTLTEGVHALGNGFLNADTDKVIKIKDDFIELQKTSTNKDQAFKMMRQYAGNLDVETQEELKKKDYEEIPHRFIKSSFYGTRCTTLFCIDSLGRINTSEQSYSEGGIASQRRDFEFVIS